MPKSTIWKHALALAVALACGSGVPAHGAGFEWGRTSNFENAPLELAIWYPSRATPREESIGPISQTVASGAAIDGDRLPLIAISHGTGGSSLGHRDTAIALADAGFVVVAVMHAGDNYRDRSASFASRNFAARARQISWVLDHMTREWAHRGRIDPARIGILGHSAGGATALLLVGGRMDMRRLVAFCRDNPGDWGCRGARENNVVDDGPGTIVGRDTRIKAAATAATAVGTAFAAEDLVDVKTPLQIWVATADTIAPDSRSIGSRLSGPRDEHVVANAGHFAFLTPCEPALAAMGPEICADPPGFDRPAFLREFHKSTIAFFRANLK